MDPITIDLPYSFGLCVFTRVEVFTGAVRLWRLIRGR